MKYTIPSTVSVRFDNLDHASAFRQFVEKALAIADQGGDFELGVLRGNEVVCRQALGHDVRKGDITHTMDVERARQEIGEAQANSRETKLRMVHCNGFPECGNSSCFHAKPHEKDKKWCRPGCVTTLNRMARCTPVPSHAKSNTTGKKPSVRK